MTRQELLQRYLLARILFWQRQLMTLEAATRKAVLDVLTEVQKDIASKLAAEAEGLLELTGWSKERDAAVNQWADEVLAASKAQVTAATGEAAIAATTASLTAYNGIYSLDGKAQGIKTVGLTAAQVKSWFQTTPLGSAGLEAWVDNAFDNGVKASILTALRRVGVEGKGTGTAVRRLLLMAVDAGFTITKRQADVLARTFILNADAEAHAAVQEANKGLIKGYERLETLDNHTCLRCALLDGARYGVDEEKPARKLHPCCRGDWLAIFKSWKDFGIEADELEEVARPWTLRDTGSLGTKAAKIREYGKHVGDYQGWWRGLTAAQQAKTAIRGKRAELLLAGKLKWQDLWDRKTGLPYTLGQMGYTKAGLPLSGSGNRPFSSWVGGIAESMGAGKFTPLGTRQTVGSLSGNVRAFLRGQGVALETSAITVGDKDIMHSLRTAKKYKLPVSFWQNLPDELDRAKAVYWDKRSPGLVYAVDTQGVKGKVVVLLNYKIRVERKLITTNTVRTGRKLVDFDMLNDDDRFLRIK